jgi:hypothetical protein
MSDEEGGPPIKNGTREWMKNVAEQIKEIKAVQKDHTMEIRALREAGIKTQAKIGMWAVFGTLVLQVGMWVAGKLWK